MTAITTELDPRYLPRDAAPTNWSAGSRWAPLAIAGLACAAIMPLLFEGNPLLNLLGLCCLLLTGALSISLYILKRQHEALIGFKQMQRQLAQLHLKARDLENELTLLRQDDSTKSGLLCILAHDLRSPFAGLKNMLWLMEQKLLDSEELQSILPDMRSQVDSLYASLDNLLIWSRQQASGQSPILGPVPVASLAREVIGMYQPAAQLKQLSLSLEGPTTGQALVDPDALRLILRNLLDNAIKFTPKGGKVSIQIQPGPDALQVWVEDSGMGMSQEQLSLLFGAEPTQVRRGTSGEKGLGLGLQLCHRYAASCGGELLVSSQPDHGTRFELRLPLRQD